jgi:hypothetical protein
MDVFAKIEKKIEKILLYYINYNRTFSIMFPKLNLSKLFYLKNNVYRKIKIFKRLVFREVISLKKNYIKKNNNSKKLYYDQEKGQKKKKLINFKKQKSIHCVLKKMIFLIEKERKKERNIGLNLKYSKNTIENFKKIQKNINEKAYGITNFSQNNIEKIENTFKKIKIFVFVFIGILIYKFLKIIKRKN